MRKHVLCILVKIFCTFWWSINYVAFPMSCLIPLIRVHQCYPKESFEELTAWGRVPCWGSFLTSTGSALTQRTKWMNPSKAPVLKPFVLQIFWCEFGEWYRSILQKSYLWISEMTPSKAPVLKLLVLQIFLCDLISRFHSLLRKLHLYQYSKDLINEQIY